MPIDNGQFKPVKSFARTSVRTSSRTKRRERLKRLRLRNQGSTPGSRTTRQTRLHRRHAELRSDPIERFPIQTRRLFRHPLNPRITETKKRPDPFSGAGPVRLEDARPDGAFGFLLARFLGALMVPAREITEAPIIRTYTSLGLLVFTSAFSH